MRSTPPTSRSHAGEFVTVVGPSGCGKSTLLRIASGLDAADRRAPSTVDRASLGYVFQDATLLQWRTVRRNVELFAELEGMPQGRARRAGPPRAIELVGLDGLRGQVPEAALRRHADARLARPVAGARTRRVPVRRAVRRRSTRSPASASTTSCSALFQRKGFGALFITHSISEAVFLSTRVLVMSARPGRIVGDFDVPFAYPRSPELRFDAGVRRAGRRGVARPAGSPRMSVDARRTSVRGSPSPTRPTTPPRRRRRAAPQAASRWSDRHRRPIIGFAVFIGLWYLMHYWALRALWDKPSFLITAAAPGRRRTRSSTPIAARRHAARARAGRRCVALTGLGISIVLGMLLADRDGPGDVGRALVLAVPDRRPGDPDPRHRADHRRRSSASGSAPGSSSA